MKTEPILRMRNVAKRFGATHALRGVSLDVSPGQVLALIGENGAGKSTLMKVLSGAHQPDAGEMELDGRPFHPVRPQDARAAGVAMIYQELNLAEDLSVEDNIMLGLEDHRFGWILRGNQRQRVRAALDELGHEELRPQSMVRDLSMGARQLVEIARALVFEAEVVVFDEPTSSLPRRDVDRLFTVIARLKQRGLGVIYISHFLEEIREVCDDYVVLRDGLTEGSGSLESTSDADIVRLMVGRSVDELFPQVPHTPGEVILRLDELTGEEIPRNVSLELRRGEILGIAGLVGAGRTELLRLLFGLDPVASGQVTVRDVSPKATPRGRTQAGLGLVSEDRKGEGLAQGMSIADNVTLNRLRPYARGGWLNLRRRHTAVNHWLERLSIKTRNAEQEVQDLSGGNQQKVALARILHQDADVLLLDEPARGIDVGTKAEIYRLIGELAADGKAILFVSSYLPELMAICDRIGVMSRGELREIRPVGEWTEEAVLSCAIGGETPQESQSDE
jgi:ribose transport system ATP-binding protein